MQLKTRLSIVALMCAASFQVASQEMDDVMVVTADRFDASPEQRLAVVNTIERTEIAQINPKSVVDLLEQLPGVSVTRTGGAGQTASVSIRGANSDHVLVLVDGARISSATLGSASFNGLSPEQIERIEVVKGPRASIWGSDAIGGVIQIFTRKYAQDEGFVGAELGSDNYSRYSAGGGISHGDGLTSVTVSKEQSDGFDAKRDAETDDDGYDRLSVGLNGLQNITDQWLISWNGQYSSGNSEYDSSWGGNEADFDNYYVNAAAQYQSDAWESKLLIGQSQDSNENFRNGVEGKSLYETTRDQVSWINQFTVNDMLTFNAGADYISEEVDGYYAQNERDITAVFALARVDINQWLLEGVVRYDDVENIDSETSFNLSAGYRFDDNWRMSLGYGTGFKAPTFNDLYWPNSGNPDLTSETSTNVDLTLSYTNEDYNAYVSVFDTEVDDLINWVNTGEKDQNDWDIYRPENVDEASIKGAEFGVNFTVNGLQHTLSYTYLDTENKLTNVELEGRSEHEADFSLAYPIADWDLRLDYHYQGKRKDGAEYNDAYHKVDASIGYTLAQNWQFRLKANNLFDEDIISNADYYGPGAQWYLSVSYNKF
ncbi:TonB-dependent receptor domain-containing protein [Shewanella livingstonensis]|uniref:TonB-dependent receptor n=1 Tax=Shewanella livingstonensis TaxID=150120 RepID=A0A3G8LUL8_9GAMM|nr:TonB-dependent receptor [Shewanella livingstonensis]AZG73291.1 TonB-dependent receptor [Shewanella livingstonensis]